MLTNLLSALIVTLGVATGVGVPFFAAHLEANRSRERRHERALAARDEALIDLEAELDAYRDLATAHAGSSAGSR